MKKFIAKSVLFACSGIMWCADCIVECLDWFFDNLPTILFFIIGCFFVWTGLLLPSTTLVVMGILLIFGVAVVVIEKAAGWAAHILNEDDSKEG